MCIYHTSKVGCTCGEAIDPARIVFHGVVSRRRGVNFSLISNTEGNQDDCVVNGSGMRSMRVVYFHVSKWVF